MFILCLFCSKRGAALYKSPFGIKFLSGVGGLAIGSLTGGLLLRAIESSPGLGALALLLITFGCAGGVMVSAESYGDRGSFLLSWLGSVGGIAAAFLASATFPRGSDEATLVAGIGGVLLSPLFSTLLYDLSRTPPQTDSGSLFNVKDGKLSLSPLPSVSAIYQHPAMLYSVKLIQVQF